MGSQSSVLQQNKNILVLGIDLLVQLDYVDSDWIKDDVNSSFDFNIFMHQNKRPNTILWCPQDNPLLQIGLSSLVSQISFEGFLLAIKPTEDLSHYRKLIHWTMNEESMRAVVLFIIILIYKENDQQDGPDEDALMEIFEEELKLKNLDSRQPKQLFIVNLGSTTELERQKSMSFSKLIFRMLQVASKAQKQTGLSR